jgi:hypothetical protein
MFLALVELEFSPAFPASELRKRIVSDLAHELSTQEGFVSYQVVEAGGTRLATVRVFDDSDLLEKANQATQQIQDRLVEEFDITATLLFAGDVTFPG